MEGKIWALPVYASGKKKGQLKHVKYGKLPMIWQIKQLVCKRCGFKWYPRVPKPKKCPQCSSYKWSIKK